MGNLTWPNTWFILLFFAFLICPLVWIVSIEGNFHCITMTDIDCQSLKVVILPESYHSPLSIDSPHFQVVSCPIGHKFHKIPIIKFMSYLSSHIFFIIFLAVTIVFPTTKIYE